MIQLAQINDAIKTAKRLSGKAPVMLLRYRRTMLALIEWQRKQKLAITKVKKYRLKLRRYEKRFGGTP